VQPRPQLTAQGSDTRYTYGWHRAEILAALVNGVFLLALCFSIFLEAIGRFFSTPGTYRYLLPALAYVNDFTEISNPKLVVIVGSFGLASNIVGLFLFHGT
jgi:solute carrier family 30 (zinc transporter), member 1